MSRRRLRGGSEQATTPFGGPAAGRSGAGAASVMFAAALAVRLAFVAARPGWQLRPGQLKADSLQFHEIAVSLVHGTGYAHAWAGAGPHHGQLVPTALRAPLWPLALASLYKVTGPSPFAGRLLDVVLSSATCALLVVLGTALAGRRAGITAGLLAALYPPLWAHVDTLWSEPLFTLLLVAVLTAAEAHRRGPSLGRAAAVGLLLGLAALARPNGLLVLVPLGVWVAWRARTNSRGAMALAALACFLGASLAVVPWEVRTARALHAVVPVTTLGGSVLAGDYSEATADLNGPLWGWWDLPGQVRAFLASTDEVAFDRAMRSRGERWISDHPLTSGRLVGLHAVRYLDIYWSQHNRLELEAPSRWTDVNVAALLWWWAVAVAAVLGALQLARDKMLGPWVPALWVWAILAASGLLLAAHTRYRVPSDPIVLLLAAVWLTRRGAPSLALPPTAVRASRHR